jgi:hypothetical protein
MKKSIIPIETLCIICFLFLASCTDNNTSKRRSDGDLDSTFKPQVDTLKSKGWEKSLLKDGLMPDCYNFIPQKSKIDNYLEVEVGSGTDVAIKLMNLESDKCIRYVYINSGSTFKIKNIPEAKYYLKIAYGKDWYSKTESKKCIGKFVKSPLYEIGTEILDFQRQRIKGGYQIPYYKLELDVISTNTLNSFDTDIISENEFNN